jgi:hypothetical protein
MVLSFFGVYLAVAIEVAYSSASGFVLAYFTPISLPLFFGCGR